MLALYDNELTNLPVTITNLTQLQDLNLDKNKLCTLSAERVQWMESQTDPDWLTRQDDCQ
jgi:Leucine-rich repeat (LRR) protein